MCLFWVYSRVIKLYIYMYQFFLKIFSHLGYYRELSRVPCAICCSVTQSCLTLCDPMDCSMPGLLVFHHLPELAHTHVHWVSDAIHPMLSSVASFSSCPQSFPVTGSFPMSWLFASGGWSMRASASATVLPIHIQGRFPLGLTDFISWQSKGLSRVFCSTTIWKHQFFSAQPFLWSNSHIHTWLLEKPVLTIDLCQQSDVSAF